MSEGEGFAVPEPRKNFAKDLRRNKNFFASQGRVNPDAKQEGYEEKNKKGESQFFEEIKKNCGGGRCAFCQKMPFSL